MTTQTEHKIRIRKAADHILEGHSAQAIVALVAETEGVSRCTARRITAKAMDLVHKDLEAVDIQNLPCLRSGCHKEWRSNALHLS